MNAQVKVYTIEIQSLSDYEYLAQKVKDYHDDVVSALLRLSHRNPKKYNLSAFSYPCARGFPFRKRSRQDQSRRYL